MDDDQLMTEILRVLEIDHQYVRQFREEQAAEIAQVRSVGRKAAREMGWKVRTFQTGTEQREDHMVVVGVVITQSNSNEDARMRERSDLLFRYIDWNL